MLEAKKNPDRFNSPASSQQCSPQHMAVPSRMAVFQRTGIPISGAMRRSDFEWSGMFSFFFASKRQNRLRLPQTV